MVKSSSIRFVLTCLFCVAVLWAAEPWKTPDASRWTKQDAERILTGSPWSQPAAAIFALAEDERTPDPGPLPGAAQAGMAGPRGTSDGRWDGGVSRNVNTGPPVLNVLVRWESALPVRLAQGRPGADPAVVPLDPKTIERDYVIAVFGLVPAGRYRSVGKPETESRSDNTIDAQNPENVLEGVMTNSRLMPRGRASIAPENVRLDGSSGALYIFFPRKLALDSADKEVMFETRFGSLTVARKFRLKDMIFDGKLAL